MKSPNIQVVSSENCWDDVQRSNAHRRAIQMDILNHFKDSTAGDGQMERLRQRFQDGLTLFNHEGHNWLPPQNLAKKIMAVRQVQARPEFERRFVYLDPSPVILVYYIILFYFITILYIVNPCKIGVLKNSIFTNKSIKKSFYRLNPHQNKPRLWVFKIQ